MPLKNIPQASKITGVNHKAIRRQFIRYGFPIYSRKNTTKTRAVVQNSSAFTGDMSSEAFYWLGFILADGCLVDNGNQRDTLSVQLQREDEGHLWKLQEFLGSETLPTSPPKAHGPMYRVCNKELYDSLVDFGMTPRKSLNVVVDERLQNSKDFWRGVIDGDGSISVTSQGYPRIRICGNYDVCEKFLKFSNSIFPNKATVRTHSSIFCVELVGRTSIPILHCLYKGSDIYLERKYQRYLQVTGADNGS